VNGDLTHHILRTNKGVMVQDARAVIQVADNRCFCSKSVEWFINLISRTF